MKSDHPWVRNWMRVRRQMATETATDDADLSEARRRDLSGADMSIAECYRRLLGMNDADRLWILDRLPDDDVRQLLDLMARKAVPKNDEEDDDREVDPDAAEDDDDEEDDTNDKQKEDDRIMRALRRMNKSDRWLALCLLPDTDVRRLLRP
jgi:hypothetical protein